MFRWLSDTLHSSIVCIHPVTQNSGQVITRTNTCSFVPTIQACYCKDVSVHQVRGLPGNHRRSGPWGISGGICMTGTGSHGTAARGRTLPTPPTTPSRCLGSPTPGTRRSRPSRCSSPRPSGPTHNTMHH
jgi:hypothetical protein